MSVRDKMIRGSIIVHAQMNASRNNGWPSEKREQDRELERVTSEKLRTISA
jgi:hypothetical protein